MNHDEIYCFMDNLRILERDKRVIIANIYNGQWTMIPKQCYNILLQGIEAKVTFDQLLECMESEDDKAYMIELFEKLDELGVLGVQGQENFMGVEQVDFAVTHRCNLQCKHCCVDAGTVKEQEILSTVECQDIIDKIIEINPKQIVFTGGEPLIRRDFLQLLEYTKSHYSGKIGLMTNALLIGKENVDKLIQNLYSIDISIDGVDEETCAAIRGKGVFGKVIEKVKLLKKKGFQNISLSMVETKETQKYAKRFDELNEELGTRGITRIFSPIGRGEEHEEFQVEEMSAGMPEEHEYSLEDERDGMTVFHCGALLRCIYINYRGQLFPCGLMEKNQYALGELTKLDSLKEYLKGRQYKCCSNYSEFIDLYPDKFEKCRDCDVNLFCWSCLHFIDMVKEGKMNITDRCEYRKRDLERVIWRS